MWIKICANTNLEDTLLAAAAGANAVGFVFAPSPRQITPALVRSISHKLPEIVERIGVFQTQVADDVIQTVESANLTGVQLHGNFDIRLIQKLGRSLTDRISITQTLHWNDVPGSLSPLELLKEQLRAIRREPWVSRVLVDSQTGTAKGGTGVTYDWTSAKGIREDLGHLKLIVAGGLCPENVGDAIRILTPWGVDVASGVERAPGQKNSEKVAAFIRNASAIPCREQT